MIPEDDIGNLGLPDSEIENPRVWVHGREFPDDTNLWEGNWLRGTACHSAAGASV